MLVILSRYLYFTNANTTSSKTTATMSSSSSQQQDKRKQEGNALVQKQQYEQAATAYTHALELDSSSEAAAAIFSNRSLCYLNAKKFNEALQDAEKAISLRPTWHRGYQRAAAACEKLEKYEEGLKHLEQCFELDEASKDDATLKKMKEDLEINNIKHKALSMTANELKQIGNTFVKNREYEKAITVYTLAIEKDAFCDEAVPILSNRSLCYFNIGKYKEAYEDAGCCCGIKPDWAKGFLRRATASQKLHEWQISLESYDEYLKLDPQDEAGVKESREYVKNKHDLVVKAETDERKRLEALDSELSAMQDHHQPEKKMAKVLEEFERGSSTMSIRCIELARKHGLPRLDTPIVMEDMDSFRPAQLLLPQGIAKTRAQLAANPDGREIHTLLARCFEHFFGLGAKVERTVAKEVAFLDFLFDIAQEEDYVTPTKMKLDTRLLALCTHNYPTRPIRKDLIFVLFDRIEIAKQVFFEKSLSNSAFATAVLFFLVGDYRNISLFKHANPIEEHANDDVCDQGLYECIHCCLKAGANLKSTASFGDVKTIGNTSTFNILTRSAQLLRSVRVVELLLRFGANPNERNEIGSALGGAFCAGRVDIARVLISHGAKFCEAPTPNFYLVAGGNHPLVNKVYSPDFFNIFSMSKAAANRFLTEELIRLVFECAANQRISFICCSGKHELVHSPVSCLIVSQANTKIAEIMIRIKPDLLNMVNTVHFRENGVDEKKAHEDFTTPLGSLITSLNGWSDAVVASRPALDFEYFKSFALALINGGLDYRTHVSVRSVIDGKKVKTLMCEEAIQSCLTWSPNKYMKMMLEFLRENTKMKKNTK